MGWHCGVATQRAGVDRLALWVHRAAATPASECTFHRHYVCPSVPTQKARDEWGEGAAEPTLSHLAVPIKDVNERRTSLEIVYAAWHVRRL